jgi:hypothetical protein
MPQDHSTAHCGRETAVDMDDREPLSPPSAGEVWATLQTLHECVDRSLARGDEYDLLLSASRNAEALLARYAARPATAREQNGHAEGVPLRKAA